MSEHNVPMIKVLFKLVQEVPPLLHFWVTVRVVCHRNTLRRRCGKFGRVYGERGTRCDHTGISLGSRICEYQCSGSVGDERRLRTERSLALVNIDSFRQVSKKSEWSLSN